MHSRDTRDTVLHNRASRVLRQEITSTDLAHFLTSLPLLVAFSNQWLISARGKILKEKEKERNRKIARERLSVVARDFSQRNLIVTRLVRDRTKTPCRTYTLGRSTMCGSRGTLVLLKEREKEEGERRDGVKGRWKAGKARRRVAESAVSRDYQPISCAASRGSRISYLRASSNARDSGRFLAPQPSIVDFKDWSANRRVPLAIRAYHPLPLLPPY